MRFLKQKFRHDPANGIYGDCHRTCFAMILNKDQEDVPNFGEPYGDTNSFLAAEDAWLWSVGLISVNTAYSASLDVVLTTQKMVSPNTLYILGGQSRTGVNHSVVGCNDKIIADPSLDDSGIIGPCDDGYYWITRFAPKEFRYVD